MDHADIVLKMDGVSFCYPGDAIPTLRSITFEIAKGDRAALIGANGSGKSTIAKIANALLIPEQGVCFICSLDPRDTKNVMKIRQRVAMVFQDPEDQIVATIVEEDAAFGPENLGLPSAEIRARVDDALKAVSLSDVRLSSTAALSGGMKQRLAIAGALAMKPDLLVLDESASMLDPEGRRDLMACLEKLNEDGMAILHITHRMDEAAEAKRILVLDEGRIAYDGPVEEFFSGEYTRWGFDEPDEIRLRRTLIEQGLLHHEVGRSVEEMAAAICL